MKNLFALIIISIVSQALGMSVYFDDGISHVIDDETYKNGYIYLDYFKENNPGTHLEISNGGVIGWTLSAFNRSTVNFTSGTIGKNLNSYFNSQVDMSGGTVTNNLNALGDSKITISGGSIGSWIGVNRNGKIYLSGSHFEVIDMSGTTTILSLGDKLSDFGTLVDYASWDYYTGTIKGILSDGSVLDNPFRLDVLGGWEGTGDIIIVPEPCSLLILGLGSLALIRCKA